MRNIRTPLLTLIISLLILASYLIYTSKLDKVEKKNEFEIEIIKSEEWGALKPKCTYDKNPYISAIIIHHTATSNTYEDAKQVIRSIQSYHMYTRGWCDIGYHFIIDKDGKIYEGRPIWAVGAHVKGHNIGNIGVALLGNYDEAKPNEKQLKALINLLTWLCIKYNIPIENIKGHKDYNPATKCPGKYLYEKLDEIKKLVEENIKRLEPNKLNFTINSQNSPNIITKLKPLNTNNF